MKRKFLLFIFLITITAPCLIARFGSGSGGSGSGSGGYSGSGSFGSRYYNNSNGVSGTDGTVTVYWLFFFLPFILTILGTVLYYFIPRYRVLKAIKKANKLVKEARKKDRLWNKDELIKHTKILYLNVQKAWMKNDLTSVKEYLTEDLYNDYTQELRQNKRRGVYNFLGDITIMKINLIGVNDLKNDFGDAFYVLIEGQMQDIMVPLGKRPRNPTKKPFKDIFIFERSVDC